MSRLILSVILFISVFSIMDLTAKTNTQSCREIYLCEEAARDNLSYYGSSYGKKVPITGDVSQLKYFFNALKLSKNSRVRIAHYGDSIILGDVISEGLRENLQAKFGGNGAGFVAINTDDFGMRKTTSIKFSNDWNEASVFKRNPKNWPLGVAGNVFIPSSSSYVQYETSRLSKSLKTFKNVHLYYKNSNGVGSVDFTFNSGPTQNKKLVSTDKVKDLLVTSASDATSVKLTFNSCTNTYFYGVSLENGNGVYLDNFPMKGQSGVMLVDITQPVLKEFSPLLDYKLIILNFGVNVVSPEYNDYVWYEKKMAKVIDHFRSAYPNASILIVSAGDKSVKKGMSFSTDPQIALLIKSQKLISEKSNVAFWNLYEAMGGADAMESWVSAKPQLALKDYCHLTSEGGRIVSDLLTEALINEYNKAK